MLIKGCRRYDEEVLTLTRALARDKVHKEHWDWSTQRLQPLVGKG